ncbi:MAG TPA: DUF3618 domain-containing protein [Sphingomicrobium sp.]|jgi:ElaB/YqjD/DUF883 family membrane-anchored ribosome-binding protein|nr:DUF3618 domain-containing protein [Sphingomicrobium sp.]
MTREPGEVTAARIEAEKARGRLVETARELQLRLSPKTLAHSAWEGAKHKGADIAEDAVDVVRARPLAATGVVAAIALFLAREPVKDLATRFFDGARSRDNDKKTQGTSPNSAHTETVE